MAKVCGYSLEWGPRTQESELRTERGGTQLARRKTSRLLPKSLEQNSEEGGPNQYGHTSDERLQSPG